MAEKKIFYKIGKVRKELESDPANRKKYEILANKLDVSKEDIISMEQRMSARDLSLDSTFDEDHELTHLDLLQDGRPDQEELVAQKEERRIQERNIHDAITRLSEKERYVIKNRIMADDPLTLREVGNHLHLSRERVRQIESEALRKLKREMGRNITPETS